MRVQFLKALVAGIILQVAAAGGLAAANETTSTASLVEPDLSDRQAYRQWLVGIHDAGKDEEYLEKSYAYIAGGPDTTGTGQLLYRQMRSMRRLHMWEQARAKANEIVSDYPKSKPAKRMGGNDGRTEDEAAFAFAEITSYYHSKQFEACIARCEDFIRNYPKNWRTHELYVMYCYALYHSGQREKLFEVGERAIAQKLVRREGRIIKFLHAASSIKAGRYDQARQLIDQLEATGENSTLKPELAKLRFDSYYYENRFTELAGLATYYAAQQTTGTPSWCTGLMWSAVARAHLDPPDLAGAAAALDQIIAADVYDSNTGDHAPTNALYWRAWVADKQGNIAHARAAVRKIRDNMPAGPVRTRALTKFSAILNQQED